MVLDGKKIADSIERDLKKKAHALLAKGVRPGLGIVLIGDNPASTLYVSLKEKMAKELGFELERKVLPSDCTRQEVQSAIDALNGNSAIHGILVQLPLPPQVSIKDIGAMISPEKDVDCFHPENLKALQEGRSRIDPPTAESVARLIQASGALMKDARIAVVGTGFFGRQIADHCQSRGAIVTRVNSRTPDLPTVIRNADIVVVAVGKPRCVTGEMIKPGAVVIDVGINRVGSEVVGDVDFESAEKVASAITPVPGGVGPLTVVLLMENVLKAAGTKH